MSSFPKHKCAANCSAEIPIELVMCWTHWRIVPRELQLEILNAGKLVDRTEFHAAVKRAVGVVSEKRMVAAREAAAPQGVTTS